MKLNDHYLVADWPAPRCVKTRVTLRNAGDMSTGNAPLLQQLNLPHPPKWLKQVHGVDVVDFKEAPPKTNADAIYTQTPGQVCAILTADCLPLLLCSKDGSKVAAVHAGWRGLSAGIIDETLKRLQIPAQEVLAWMGPAIGMDHFEVGEDVREKFMTRHPEYTQGFQTGKDNEHWFADLYRLAQINFSHCQVQQVYGGGFCTYCDDKRFFSYRREKSGAGRMASLIWIDPGHRRHPAA